ncbi:MAG: hypothetical protein LUH45_03655 [Clostridiales bacterium]|nr:hypothetical protein [Clostridiales bacterium]
MTLNNTLKMHKSFIEASQCKARGKAYPVPLPPGQKKTPPICPMEQADPAAKRRWYLAGYKPLLF